MNAQKINAKKSRFSPQRACIQEIVNRQSGHLSVDSIFEEARKKYSKISLATVYRNLQQLEQAKAISSIQGKDQRMYYEAFADPHHHFICETCGSIENVETPTLPTCMSCITQTKDWHIRHIVTTLYGKCKGCLGVANTRASTKGK